MALSTTTIQDHETDEKLDLIFRGLGHRVRRAILRNLSESPLLVTEIAAPFDKALPTISKHIRVLEEAGLVIRAVDGRIHRCSFGPEPLRYLESWLEQYRPFWEGNLDSFARYAETIEESAEPGIGAGE